MGVSISKHIPCIKHIPSKSGSHHGMPCPFHGHNYTLKIRRNPRKVSMQHQHSCGTLESRINIFGCTVKELYITFYPLDHYPLLHRACVHIKGV